MWKKEEGMRKDLQDYYEKVVTNLESENLEASAIAVRHILEIIANEYTNVFVPEQTYSDTFKKINVLLEKEFISKETATILHELRQIGNKGAHVKEGDPLTSVELKRCLAPLKMVIDEFEDKIEEEEDTFANPIEMFEEEEDTFANPIEMFEPKQKTNTFENLPQMSKKEEEFNKWLMLASNAFANCDFKQAEQYYKKCLAIDPMDWIATFYSTYCYCMEENDLEKASQEQIGCLSNVFLLIKNKYGSQPSLMQEFLRTAVERTIEFQQAVDTQVQNIYYNMPINSRAPYVFWLGRVRATTAYSLYTVGNLVEKEFFGNEEIIKLAIKSWKAGINIHCDALKSQDGKSSHKDDIAIMTKKVQKYQSSYTAPTPSGCYIATAVYHSYDCPEVWTLRRFRDECLDETWYGRLFIKVYYFISPKLLKIVGNNKLFEVSMRKFLDWMVTKLQLQGYQNTPYKDKSYKSK